MSRVFFLVVARDNKNINQKLNELKSMKVPFVIVTGEKSSIPNVIFREPKGKYDAINYGSRYINDDCEIVCLNDVDTKIYNFEKALKLFDNNNVGMVFCKVNVMGGVQPYFYRLLDNIRKKILVAASGELILIKNDLFKRILPLPPCKAEDTYILFKVLELGYKVVFCEDCWVITERTKTLAEEADYKRRTVCGIYQALSYTKPPILIRVFYLFLPIMSFTLILLGKKGIFWIKGITKGMIDFFILKDREGKF
jgi:cellulose synthase/poly-beta-1,6-N-acetylglucosamine synthase-like glycosyltransferase